MRRMIFGAVAVGVMLVPILAGQMKKTHTPAATIARGKYLVESIGMCGDCHTPHDQKGEPIKAQWLQGTRLAFQPTLPMPVWADKSSSIAGLPGWDKDAAIKFFMTGLAANGLPARPPMPQYRYTQQDAVAIVAYLKSLAPAK
jgi:mono/diheme cytochrome c family protein